MSFKIIQIIFDSRQLNIIPKKAYTMYMSDITL